MAAIHVVVVGAGPAGASLAYLLARRGIRVTLLERQTDFAREFRGEALMPSGIDAFRQMGLGAELDALPRSHPREVRVYQGRRHLFSIDIERLGGDVGGPRFISQPALLEMLVERAAELPGFRLERGCTVRDLERRDGRVVGVRADGPDGPRRLDATLVVGADGRASVVRKRSVLERPPSDPQVFDVVWCRVPPFEGSDDAVRFYLCPGHLCVAFPTHDGRLQLGWVIEKGAYGELRRRGIDEWVAELSGNVSPDLSSHLERSRDRISQPFLLDVVCDRLQQWSAPGLLLVGDAAHPMSPVGGQGINIALRDTLVAANHLVPVLARGGSPLEIETACRRVRDERLPEVRTIQQMQQGAPRMIFQRSAWSRFLIGRLAPLVGSGALSLLMATAGRRFALGTTEVRLTA